MMDAERMTIRLTIAPRGACAIHAEYTANIVRIHMHTGDCIVDKQLAEKIIAHVERAMKVERNRQPVLRVDSKRPSSRIECLMCGVGIRRETFEKLADTSLPMHPNCKKVHDDPSLALSMPTNSHAARAILDRLYVQAKRNTNDDSVKREELEKRAHAEMLARFEAQEIAREADEASA